MNPKVRNDFVRTRGLGIAGSILLATACRTTPAHEHDADRAALDAAKREFFAVWNKQPGVEFDARRLAAILDDSNEFLSFDAMSPQSTVLEGAERYTSLWKAGMNGFASGSFTEVRSLRTWLCGDGALTASLAHVHATTGDGQVIDLDAHLTLGWRRTDAGWRVVHEHMSTGVKP